MTDLPERPNPQSIQYAQEAVAVVTAFANDDWRTVNRWVATKMKGGPQSAQNALAGMLSVAGALLMEASQASGATIEEVVQRVGLRFAEMEADE
jgi:uncharacterized alpha-E superfamily protein